MGNSLKSLHRNVMQLAEFTRPAVMICSAEPISYFEVLDHVGGMTVLRLWVGLVAFISRICVTI